MKKIIALSLVAGGLAFAQSGLQGGTSGIHQHNAYTLGQWGIELGTGGDVSTDSWSQSRGGVLYQGNNERSFHGVASTLTGNIHAAIGLKDFIDLGVALPLYYDHANLKGKGEGDLWKASRGDLNVWLKAGLVGDSKSFFGLAIQGDVYFPTGDENVGVRPRHAWYLNDDGDKTNPYTSNEVNFAGTVVFSLNFGALGVPVLWNTHAGFVYASEGTNTLVYGTGLNVMPTSWLDIFAEFSGEMRVEDGAYRRDPMDDPMLLTPGLRFHLPWHIDLALGADIAIRTLGNLGYDRDEEMKNVQHQTIRHSSSEGNVSYGYAPTPTVAVTAALTWRFGGNVKDVQTDSDADGVPDAKDQCEKTPAGAVVDSTGCPLDSDKDGIFDGLDKCQNTRGGASVDSLGCEPDFDKDGIPDALDKCPNTAEGVKADSVGCPQDTDKDGVPDGLDKCENTPAGLPIDETGCPADADKDGVPDALDKCPDTKAGLTVDNTGCPLDFDKDGVPDGIDQCPNTQQGVPVDSVGCAADADKDGVYDGLDKCADTPKGAAVDTAGCPVDSDKDGVADFLDKCPNTLEGVRIDKKGCPLNKAEDLEQLKKGINFQSGSKKLTKASYKTLNNIVKLMKKFSTANIEVQGHTDNTGSEETNKQISQDRAQVVVDYFIQNGISSDRVRAVGFGSDKPIADNKTKKGRSKNRRVELVPF